MLAEVVLRPPDVRHLDAAFQGMAASPRRESSLKVSIGDLFATRCATCGRTLVVDEIVVGPRPTDERWPSPPAAARPIARHYRCTVCRDQRGGAEHRQAPLDADDLVRATADVGGREVRARRCAAGSRRSTGAETLVDELLDLHTPRQLVGLAAILDADRERPARGAGPGRAPAGAAPRDPAGQPARDHGRAGPPTLRIAGGPRPAAERDPVARTQPVARVRGRVPDRPRVRPAARGRRARARPGAARRGPAQPRRGGRDRGPRALPARRACAPSRDEPAHPGRSAAAPRIRLVLGQPPMRPEPRTAGRRVPRDVVGPRARGRGAPAARRAGRRRRCAPPWSWQAAAIGRALEAVEPAMARDGRVVLLVDGGPEALVAAVLGGASAGLPARQRAARRRRRRGRRSRRAAAAGRRPAARPADAGERRRCDRSRAAPATRTSCPGAGLFAAPERFDQRPFSAAEAARTVTETAVEMLRARGEPARYERLLGEILVGLDRAGQLRRLATADHDATAATGTPVEPGHPGRSETDDGAGRRPVSGFTGATRDAADGPAAVPVERSGRRRIAARRRREASAGDGVARPGRSAARAHPRRAGPAHATGGSSRSSPAAGGSPTRDDREARRGPARRPRRMGRLQPPVDRRARCPRRRSSSGSPRCSPATTCRTRRSSGPASTATGAWPARPTGWSPATTCSGAARSTRSCSRRSPTRGHRLGMRVWIGAARADPPDATASSLGDLLDEREKRAYLGAISRAGRGPRRRRLHLVRPRQGGVPVRGRVDRDARRAAPAPSRAHPARRRARPVPRHRPGADRARPLQARPLAAAARRPSRTAAGTSSSPTTCARFLGRESRSTSPTWSPTSASIRSSSGAASRCRCSAAEPRVRGAAALRPSVNRDPTQRRRATHSPRTRCHVTQETHVTEPMPARRVDDLADRFWEAILELNPTTATFYGDDRYADRLEDPGPEGRAEDARAHGADRRRGARDRDRRPADRGPDHPRHAPGHRRAQHRGGRPAPPRSSASSTRWAGRSSSCRS